MSLLRPFAHLLTLFIVLNLGLGDVHAQTCAAEMVVIEAETADLDGAWAIQQDVAGFTGSGYVVASDVEGTLSYPIEQLCPGRYHVLMRTAAPHPTEHNDSWIKLTDASGASPAAFADNGPACSQFEDGWYKMFSNESNDRWTWNNKNCDYTEKRLYYEVTTAGPHVLELRARSTLHKVDRIVLEPVSGNRSGAQTLDEVPGERQPAMISGELKTWHRITLDFEGPDTSEQAEPNPFSDHRLTVTFTQNGRRYVVPGFFAGDGQTAESSADAGSTWRVHFAPDAPGTWHYSTSFRTGPDVALSLDPFAGSPSHFDGQRGTFTVNPTDKTGTDFRAKGRLVYTRERYLRHAGTREPFIKGGAGSPENLLAYADFDGTMDNGGPDALPGDGLHRYGPHVDDWTDGDPQWKAGKGKGLIGGLNYLAAQDINAIYLLLMNWRGDGDDVWPWPAPEQQDRFDVSKLDQWEIVFAHMDQLGIAPNMLVQETENDTLFDGGSLGRLRKLYFREMVARFGHHLGVTWNLGEENNNSTAERVAFAEYIAALDPYDHPIVVHNHVHLVPETYDPLLGVEPFTGPSFQLANPGSVHSRTIQYLDLAEASGRPWVVPIDEIGHYSIGASPDGEGNNHDEIRRDVLWGNLMAGGAGVEWYFGYTRPHADLNLEDWRSRHDLWRQTATALNFFRTYLPFDEMQHHDGLTWPDEDYVLAKPGEVYAVYLPAGGTTALEVKDYPNRTFSVQWFDPRKGSPLMAGSISFVQGGSNAVMLGTPPYEPNADWVILVRAVDR